MKIGFFRENSRIFGPTRLAALHYTKHVLFLVSCVLSLQAVALSCVCGALHRGRRVTGALSERCTQASPS